MTGAPTQKLEFHPGDPEAETEPPDFDRALIACVSVVGTSHTMGGGYWRVRVDEPKGFAFVRTHYWNTVQLANRVGTRDVSDCTSFEVVHSRCAGADLREVEVFERFFERSLQAVNTLVLWNKAHDLVQNVHSFSRQFGRVDAKLFLLCHNSPDGSPVPQIVWDNPTFLNRNALHQMAEISPLANSFNNQPAESPLEPPVRRAMASLDLFNLGFYTEAMITMFSLFDDLTQNVVSAGLAQTLSEKEQERMLRAVKEQRLDHFLNVVTKLCGWKALADEDPKLWKQLEKVNSLRNDVMHDSKRLTRPEAAKSVDVLRAAMQWLRSNPFQFAVPDFPILTPAWSPPWHSGARAEDEGGPGGDASANKDPKVEPPET